MIGRGFTEHMRFGLAHPDGTTEMLACADWCYACKLDAANARAERAEAGAKILSASIARVQMLHQPCQFVESWTCAECARTGAAAPDWPCPTIAAVDGPADQLAAALPLEALDADALTRLIRAAQYRRAEIDPDRCPADCAEGHTYTAPCSGAYPDSGSDRGAAEVSRSLGGMVDRMLGGNVGAAFTDPAPPVPTYADLLTIATECRVPKPRRTGERSTASTASGLTVVTTDPVEEIAAEPATLDRLKRQFLEVPAGRIGALPGQIGDFFGFPLMVDEGLPPGEVHMRPMYRMDEAQP
jgi:hypothetical protein